MKRFELTIVTREPGSWSFKQLDRIEADDLVELCAQLQLMLVVLQRKLHEEDDKLRSNTDDDIPF